MEENKDIEQLENTDANVETATEDTTVVTQSNDTVPVVEEVAIENPVEQITEEVNKEQAMTPVEEKEEKPKSKKKKWIVVCVVLLLLILLAAGYFLLFNKPVKKTTKAKPKEVHSKYRMSGNSLEAFDLYFLQLENEEKNKVYSPLSIKYALEMLAEGADGDTKAQLDAVIGDYKAKKYPNNDHMSFANAMFIRNSFKDNVKEEYTKTLKDKYNAEVIYDEFKDPKTINDWVSNKTFKLIPSLVDDVSGNDFFLINALAIDMNWNNQIHCTSDHKIPCINDGTYHIDYPHEKLDDDAKGSYGLTRYPYTGEDDFYGSDYEKHVFNGEEKIKGAPVFADFNKYDIIKDLGEDKIRELITPEYEEWLQTSDGKSAVEYNPEVANVEDGIDKFIKELKANYGKKANSTDFLVHEDDNVKVFAKDLKKYDDTTLQYVGIMPKEDKLTEFVKSTNKEELNKIIKELKEVNIDSFEEGYVTRIRGFVPFFKFEDELKLKEDLKELGIKDVFDSDKSDLSKMTSKAVIDKAIHKATVELSNDGIKASAATSVGGYGATHGPQFEHLFKVPVKDIDVTFDKPYMFIIRDKDSGEVWFAGTVYEPIKK